MRTSPRQCERDVPKPGEGNEIEVTATLSDQYGNTSEEGSDKATVDTLAGDTNAAPVVEISEDTNNDGVISSGELSGDIDVKVTLPAGAVKGDTITVSDGTTDKEIELTDAHIAAGNVSTTFPSPGEGNEIEVTVTFRDQYGNTSEEGSDKATVDTLAGDTNAAPVVEISEDTNNDGVISSGQLSGDIDVKVTLPAGAVKGDTITVSDGATDKEIELTDAHIAAGNVGATFPAQVKATKSAVTATLSDQYGNTSEEGSDKATVDTLAGDTNAAPVVEISEDTNNDGVISSGELSGDIDVKVTLPAGAVKGNTITVSDGTTDKEIELTDAHIAAGNVSTTFPSPGEGNEIEVTATLSDQYGNTSEEGSDKATVDTLAGDTNAAPVVEISEDTNNDGVISSGELSGDIDVKVTLPAGAVKGDTITVSDGTTDKEIELTDAHIAAGNVSTTFPSPGEGNEIEVTATLSDQYGNTSEEGSDKATVDTLAGDTNAAPVVEISEDTNNDGVISSGELSGDIDVKVTLPAGAVKGDTITVSDGTTDKEIELTDAHIAAGNVSTTFPSPGEGNEIEVTATLSDQYGNTSEEGSDKATVDTLAGDTNAAPVVEISEDTNNDGVISSGELSGDIDVKVTLPAGAVKGDTITVSDGTTDKEIELTDAHIAAGNVSTTFPSPGEGNEIEVTATLSDQYGNTSEEGSDKATVDTLAGDTNAAPVVEISEDTNNDGVISSGELSGDIDVKVTLPAGAVKGDTITVSDGTTDKEIELTDAHIAAGNVSTTFPSPGEGNEIEVTATLSDQYGNTSEEGSDKATVDTLAGDTNAAPVVEISEDTNNDGVISSGELSGDIDVKVTLPAGAVKGDTITVSDGTTDKEIELTDAHIAAGNVSTTFPSPGEGNEIEVTATLSDQYGNTSEEGSDKATVDTLAGDTNAAPVVEISEDTNNDGVISSGELSGDIDVKVTLPAGAVKGDTITVSDGTTDKEIELTDAHIAAGNVSTTFPSPGEGNEIEVTATLSDQYGNTSEEGSDKATVDTLAGDTNAAPVVEISEDTNNDGVISSGELSGDIDVKVTLPAGAVKGDTITVSDGTTDKEIELTDAHIAAGNVSTTFPSPGEGNEIEVTATLSDQYGNTSEEGSDKATVDTLAGDTNAAPVVEISEDTNNDGVISSGELSGDIDVKVTLPAGAVKGDTITVSDGTTDKEIELTDAHIAAGNVSTTFPSPGEGNEIEVTATLSDQYGNTSEEGSDKATVDTLAGDTNAAPVVEISEDTNNDGVISSGELSGDIDVKVTLPAGAVKGDTITVSDGTTDKEIELTDAHIAAGNVSTTFPSPGEGNEIEVTATLSDQYGNTSEEGSDKATVDTLAGDTNAAPVVEISEDTNNDGVISSGELSGDIDVKVTLPAGAVKGDTITVSDGTTDKEIELTDAHIAAGNVSTTFPSPGEGNEIEVTATLSDQYGNTSEEGSDKATVDTLAGDTNAAPVVEISEDTNNDGVISSGELSGDIDVKVTLPAGAVKGDTITVSDGTTDKEIELTDAHIAAGNVSTTFPSPGEGNEIEVTATLSDQYGNTSEEGSDKATVDTLAGDTNAAPVVEISEDTNNDGVISSGELSGDIDVKVTLPAGAVKGDTITVSDGTTDKEIELTDAHIAAGNVSTTFPSPGEGNEIEVTATLSDQYGNTSEEGSDKATVDTLAGDTNAAPVVEISEDTNNDGVISSGELSGDIDVKVTLPAGAVKGDTITVSDGTTDKEIELTDAHIAAGNVSTTFPSPGEGNEIEVTATLSDQYGNTSEEGSDKATVDTLAGDTNAAPVVEISEDTNNDGVISSGELSGDIDVKVTLPAGAVKGDTITVSDGTTDKEIELTDAHIAAGNVSTTFPSPGEGNEIEVTATLSDQYGNTSEEGSDKATVDTLAGDTNAAPVVEISEDTNNDGVISSGELSGDIDVKVTLPAGAVKGDTITVSDGTTDKEIELTDAHIAAGNVSTTFPSPGEGNEIEVTATLSDQYGNTSEEGSDKATVDTLAGDTNAAPVVEISEDTNNDGVISSGELSGDIDVKVTLPAGAVKGDTITVSDGTTDKEIELTDAHIAAGNVSTTFPSPGEGNEIEVTATLSDQYGNTSEEGSDKRRSILSMTNQPQPISQ
ncbi:beta strand repeat-containing protein [Vibrio fortis]|uniref:beta strand repeat-containing protein n=1 Tax=Vibrio fortis TaxID=212667 RepID=UPI0038CD7EBC